MLSSHLSSTLLAALISKSVLDQYKFWKDASGHHLFSKEMHDKEIDLPEDAPMIVEKVFKFPYSGTYSDDEDSDQLPSDPSMMGSADAQDELGGTDRKHSTSIGLVHSPMDFLNHMSR
jgi:hypothetical protein